MTPSIHLDAAIMLTLWVHGIAGLCAGLSIRSTFARVAGLGFFGAACVLTGAYVVYIMAALAAK